MKVVAIPAKQLVNPPPVSHIYADFVPSELKEAVVRVGAMPVVLPFPEDAGLCAEYANAAVALFDALILSGGQDVDPSLYGEEPVRAMGVVIYQRDVYEIALVRAAVAARKPVFGICRGMQVVNVALGGTLYQDLPTQNPASYVKHRQEAPEGYHSHSVDITPGTRLASILGASHRVNSMHHQAVRDLAPGLKASAFAKDGVIEAVESAEHNILAVQWHPETMWRKFPQQLGLFLDLAGRCGG